MIVIRVFVIDNREAICTGLEDVLHQDPGVHYAGGALDEYKLRPVLDRAERDVVILEHRPPGESGLLRCLQIRARVISPSILIRSAHADERLALAAMIAGADGLVPENASAQELTHAIRQVSAGGRVTPEISLPILREAQETLGPEDWLIVAMLLNPTLKREATMTLRIDDGALTRRVQSILGLLSARSPAREPVAPDGAPIHLGRVGLTAALAARRARQAA